MRVTVRRSLLVDGPPLARLGGGVHQIVPIDADHAYVLGFWGDRGTFGSRVWRWTFADGAVAWLADGPGDATTLSRDGRLFFGNLNHIKWLDLHDGRAGELFVDAAGVVACTPDGRHILTRRVGDGRVPWLRVTAVEGGDPFPEARVLTFSADGRHTVHLDGVAGALVRTDLADRRTATVALGPGDWRGLCPVGGTSRVLAWTADQLATVDLVELRVVELRPVAFEPVAAAGDTALVADTADHRRSLLLLDLRGGRRQELGPVCGQTYALTDDGRLLRAHHVLDVIDARSGAVHSAHRGHTNIVRQAVWTADGALLATVDDDGQIRVHDLAAPSAPPTQMHVPAARRITFLPDGRLCALTRHALCVLDPTTGVVIVRQPADEENTHSLCPTHDGRRVVTARYYRGVRITDLITGESVAETNVTRLCTVATVIGDRIFTVAADRVAYTSNDARYVLAWAVLDLAGDPLARGAWLLDHASDLEVTLDDTHALVQGYQGGWFFRLHDLSAPQREPANVARTGPILDHRRGRVLVHEAHDLVLRDAAGHELTRLTCARDVLSARLSPDAARVAVVYADMGVEVFVLG